MYTPGPWEFDGNCGGYVSQGGLRIARGYALDDACLIASAPTMADALKKIAAFDSAEGRLAAEAIANLKD
jgi:hypothetical protein